MESSTRIAVFLGLGLAALGAIAGEIRHSTNDPLWASGSVMDSNSRALLRIGVATSNGNVVEAAIPVHGPTHNADQSGAEPRQSIDTPKRGTKFGQPHADTARATKEAFGPYSLVGREPVNTVVGGSSRLKDASANTRIAPNFPAGVGIRAGQRIDVTN